MLTGEALVDKVIEEVRKLAKEFPDNIYHRPDKGVCQSACSYLEGECTNGSKGCIFGQVLRPLGYKITYDNDNGTIREHLVKFANLDPYLLVKNTSFDACKIPIWVKMLWCSLVQEKQDEGLTWSEAIHIADDWIKRF